MATPPPPFQPNHHVHFSPLRRIQAATDSDGHHYKILVQGEEMSCGMAAAVMLVHLNRHGSMLNADTEQRYKAIGAKFPGSLVQSDKLWASGNQTGADVKNVAALLNSQGIATHLEWATGSGSMTPKPAKLHRAAIFLWGWYPSGRTGKRNGGHFTVAARMTRAGKVVILNPWYGKLDEVQPGANYQGDGLLDWIIYT